MKKITLSADDELIERARLRARDQKTSLNAAFREWLERYAGQKPRTGEYWRLMKRLAKVRPGRKFTREELNPR